MKALPSDELTIYFFFAHKFSKNGKISLVFNILWSILNYVEETILRFALKRKHYDQSKNINIMFGGRNIDKSIHFLFFSLKNSTL